MADEIQGGLSIPVKETTKGALVPSGTMSLGPEENAKLLASMQKIIDERQSPLNLFMSGLKDASAAGSGGRAGPTAAIQMRDEQKAKEAAELFKMRTDMAGLRAAQTQQELLKKQYESVNPPAGTAATPGTAGAPSIPGLTAQQINTIANNPSVKAELDTLAPNDYAGRLAVIKDAAKTEFGAATKGKYEAAGNKPEVYTIPGIGPNGSDGLVSMTPNEYLEFKATRKLPTGQAAPSGAAATPTAGTTNLGNMRPVGQSTGFQPPVSVDKDLARIDDNLKAYGDKGINTLSGIINRWAPPSENDTPTLIKNASQFLGIDPNQKIDLTNPAVRQALSTAIIKQEGNLQKLFATPAAAAPAAAASDAPQMKDYGSVDAYKNALELYKQKQAIPVEAAKQEATTYATETGKDLAQLKKDTARAMATPAAADRVIKMADDPKLNKVMGWMHGGSTPATYLGAVPRLAAEMVGKGDKVEEMAKQLAWSGDKDLIAADERLSTDATQLGIEYTQQMFKGARLGIGLEKLGLKGKGVSPEFLPQVNKLYATIARDGAEFEVKKNTAFEKWHNDDPLKTYGKFLATPEYEKMMKDERDLLISRYPGITVDVLDAPSDHKTTKSGVKYKVL